MSMFHVKQRRPEKPEKDVFIKEQESTLREKFGTTVHIKQTKNKGKIEIEFFSKEDLNRILEIVEKHKTRLLNHPIRWFLF